MADVWTQRHRVNFLQDPVTETLLIKTHASVIDGIVYGS